MPASSSSSSKGALVHVHSNSVNGEIPTTMKALLVPRYGLLEVATDVPVPKTLKPNEVLIRVHATSVNALDWRLYTAQPAFLRCLLGCFQPRYPTILGADVAGRIVACGSDVNTMDADDDAADSGKQPIQWKVGDEVIADASAETRFGAMAEYVVISASFLVRKPPSLSFAQVAGLPMAAHTAWEALHAGGSIEAEESVLVNGASGGVGLYAVQLAAAMGARVTAVCSASKFDLVKQGGAVDAVDHKTVDFTSLSPNKRFQKIIDIHATRPFSAINRVLHPMGKYIVLGGPVSTLFKFVFVSAWNSRVVVVSSEANVENLGTLVEWMKEGKIKTFVDRVVPLSEAASAVKHVESGQVRGKVIVSVLEEEK